MYQNIYQHIVYHICSMAKKTGWSNVRVPTGLLEEVERTVKESGGAFTSRADFVKAAIREKLERKVDIMLARDVVAAFKRNPELKKKLLKK